MGSRETFDHQGIQGAGQHRWGWWRRFHPLRWGCHQGLAQQCTTCSYGVMRDASNMWRRFSSYWQNNEEINYDYIYTWWYMMIHDDTWWYMMFQARWWWLWATTAWSQIKSTGKEVVVRTPKLGQNSAGERGASSFSWRKNHWSDKVSGCCLLTKQRSENEHVGMGWSHQPVYTTDTSVYTPVLVAHVSWISWIYQCLVPAISSYEFNLLPHVPQSQNEWNHPPKWKDSGPNNSKSCCVCVPIGSIGTQFIPEFRYVGVLFLLGSSELFF